MSPPPFIGIDLGTTNSVVATVQGGQAVVIRNRAGSNLTPSVVALAASGKRLVGTIARRQAITNAENTVYAVKRFIGRKWSSPHVQAAARLFPYQLVAGSHDDVRVRLGGKDYAVPELSAMVLSELKADAEAFLGRDVKHAVITVPAYFNDGQRQATRDAGLIAGLEVLRIINEPTAAALAYGFGKGVEGKIAVFDLGGGTFDISVLELSGEVFQVLATGGDTFLGGEDFDRRIMDWVFETVFRESRVDLRADKMALQRIKEASEKAKHDLSAAKEAQLNLPFLHSVKDSSQVVHFQKTLTRLQLEELSRDLVDRCLETTARVLEEAGVRATEIREVVLVGGMTRMPRVQEAVKKFFGREPCKSVHPDEVVALGAAIQASALIGQVGQQPLAAAPPFAATSVADSGNFPAIDIDDFQAPPAPGRVAPPVEVRSMPQPVTEPALETLPLTEPFSTGPSVVLLDVTPHALGIAIAGGYSKILIPKNTTVPTSATHLFHTSKDFQTNVKVMVLQGEGQLASQNELLGEFMMTGLRAATRGEVEIEITFDISADGIVSVSARDTVTGKRASITVTASGGLTREELSNILDEQRDYLLEAHVDEEVLRKRGEIGRLVHELESRLPRVRQLLASSSLAGDVVAKAEGAIRKGKALAESKDLGKLSEAQEDLNRMAEVFRGVIQRLGGSI